MLDGLFENAPVGFTYVDTDLRYRRVNASVAALNGGSVQDRIGRTIDEVHGEPCGPQFSAACRDVIRTGEVRRVRIEGRLWHGRGPYQVWRMNYYPVFGKDGEIIGVGDVFLDVTDTERTVTRYESLIEATSAAVWIVDAEGRPIPDAHPAREAGLSARVHPADRANVEKRWREAVETGATFDQVARLGAADGAFRHFRIRAVPVVVDGTLTEWIGSETDIETEIRARTRLELLERASEAMNREMDPVRELEALARALVPAFADACTVHLLDPLVPGGPVTGRRLLSQVDDDLGVEVSQDVEEFSYSGDHPFVELIRTGRPMLLHHPLQTDAEWARAASLAHWERELGWRTTLLAPIRSGRAVIAVLAFVAVRDRSPFSPADETFVGELAARASVAVAHAQRFKDVRHAALTLQQAMLTKLPVRTDVQIEARYQPAQDNLEVGGDWYDGFTLPGGDLGLVVGDVVGHDLQAAAVMGQLRSMFRAVAMDDSVEPPAAVERLNELAIALGITAFTTLVYARLRCEPGGGATLTWCSAGHPPAMLVQPGRETRLLSDGAGMAIGVARGRPRSAGSTLLDPGATLLFYTDGLIERRTEDLDDMTARLQAVAAEIADTPLPYFCDTMLTQAAPDTGDDIALLAVRLPASLDVANGSWARAGIRPSSAG